MKTSYTGRLVKNATWGVILKLLTLIFTFVNRTMFIRVLGEQYLGINGLYSNILSILSLADLGVNSVMIFFLYEPLTHKDIDRLSTLISYFKKVYYTIAGGVLGFGLILMPFLRYMVNGVDLSTAEIQLYYLLFLVNICCSYFAVYKSTMLIADQLAYIVNAVNFVFTVVQSILQIVVLYITGNYVYYLLAIIACTLGNNALLTFISEKRYPFLRNVDPQNEVGDLKKKIYSNIKNVFLYRVGGTIMNSTDNILISILIGTTVVGYYSNYELIITNLTALLMIFSQAMMTSMGSFGVDADKEKKERVFRSSMLIYAGIAAFSASCIITMMNDFISIWLENDFYLLSDKFVWVLAFKLFIDIISSPNWTFRDSAGIFKEVRYIMFIAAIINLVLSVVLAKPFGLAGIIAATSISKIVTLFWYEPRIIYKNIFCKPLMRYWRYQLELIIACLITVLMSYVSTKSIPCSFGGVFLKIGLSACCTVVVFTALLRKKEEFKFCMNKVTSALKIKTING